jgi:hypothetical protein
MTHGQPRPPFTADEHRAQLRAQRRQSRMLERRLEHLEAMIDAGIRPQLPPARPRARVRNDSAGPSSFAELAAVLMEKLERLERRMDAVDEARNRRR